MSEASTSIWGSVELAMKNFGEVVGSLGHVHVHACAHVDQGRHRAQTEQRANSPMCMGRSAKFNMRLFHPSLIRVIKWKNAVY